MPPLPFGCARPSSATPPRSAHEAGNSRVRTDPTFDLALEHVEPCGCRARRLCPVQAPLKALNNRLVRFLRQVKLSDIISAPRVDVPLEMVGTG